MTEILGMPVPEPRRGKFDDKVLEPLKNLESVLNILDQTVNSLGAVTTNLPSHQNAFTVNSMLQDLKFNVSRLRPMILETLYDGRAAYVKRFEEK